MALWETVTFSVFQRQPSHQSRAGDPVTLPTLRRWLIEAEGKLDLHPETVKRPDPSPPTSVQTPSIPAEQKRFEFCHRNTLPLLSTNLFLLMTDRSRYDL